MALNVQERHMEASIRGAQGLTIERRIFFSSCPSLKTFERFMARRARDVRSRQVRKNRSEC